MKRASFFIIAFIVVVIGFSFWISSISKQHTTKIQSFDQCAKAGYPIMKSLPPQCITQDGQIFVEEAVSQICRYQQECDKGYFCRFGVCTEFNPEMSCQKDDDCQLIREDYGFSCCYIGACMPIDYAEDEWIAVNKQWFEQGKKQYCPSDAECGPAPMCAVQSINESFSASCVQVQCITTPCPPRCTKVPL